MGNINTRIDGATDDLANRVQSLPQELFDKIYDQVFTSAGGERINIDSSKTYKPPHLLAVDHKSRELFAKCYYSRNIFVIEVRPYSIDPIALGWLKALSAEHCIFLYELCAAITFPVKDEGEPRKEMVKRLKPHRDFVANCAKCDVLAALVYDSGEVVVHVEIHFEGDDEVVLP